MVFLKTFYEINDWLTFFPRNDWISLEERHSLVIYLIGFKISSKKSCVFYENPEPLFLSSLSCLIQNIFLKKSEKFCKKIIFLNFFEKIF